MFKLLAFLSVIAVISAKPTNSDVKSTTSIVTYGEPLIKTALLAAPGHVAIAEPTFAKVGEYIKSVPTAVSHQSSTIVHRRANVVSPIIAPAVRTHLAPYAYAAAGAAPFLTYQSNYPFASYYGAPYYLDGYAREQLYKSYA